MDQVVKAILVLMLAFVLQYAYQLYKASQLANGILEDIAENEELVQHTTEFHKAEVIQVTTGIWVAIGYALANSIMIDAPGGLIIVDTTEAISSATSVYEAFRKIQPNKPIKTIMYTHNHADHTFGASEFLDDPESPPDVWAHELFMSELEKVLFCAAALYRGAMRQFGTYVPVINAGIGPSLQFDKEHQTSGILWPTHYLKEESKDVTINGLNMTLLHIPGETDDHMGMWIPSKDVFLCGDDLYKSFPNLYAIRGTPARDNMKWVNSLDKIRDIEPRILIPSHSRPIVGREKVLEIVTVYRDAIQFVHDQTVRYMNKGMHPVEIAKRIRLPRHIESHPYLRPFYGNVEWSSKAVFSRYLGWFSGDPVELNTLAPLERAERMVELGNGREATLQQARKGLQIEDFQWALELSSYVYRLDRYDADARQVRTQALKALAAKQKSANGRNYYLTAALEDNDVLPELKLNDRSMIYRISHSYIFRIMSSKIKVELCEEVNMTVVFNISDIKEVYQIYLRNGIAETTREDFKSQIITDVDVKVTVTDLVWRSIVARERSLLWAYLTGDIYIEPGILKLKELFDCLERE